MKIHDDSQQKFLNNSIDFNESTEKNRLEINIFFNHLFKVVKIRRIFLIK